MQSGIMCHWLNRFKMFDETSTFAWHRQTKKKKLNHLIQHCFTFISSISTQKKNTNWWVKHLSMNSRIYFLSFFPSCSSLVCLYFHWNERRWKENYVQSSNRLFRDIWREFSSYLFVDRIETHCFSHIFFRHVVCCVFIVR